MVRRLRKASSGRAYPPTYTKDVLYILVDSGEAEEAGSLLAAAGNSPLRFAGSTCLSGGAKKFEVCTTWKNRGAYTVPLSRFHGRLCNGWHCASRRNVRQIITRGWNHGRLYFQVATHWMAGFFSCKSFVRAGCFVVSIGTALRIIFFKICCQLCRVCLKNLFFFIYTL